MEAPKCLRDGCQGSWNGTSRSVPGEGGSEGETSGMEGVPGCDTALETGEESKDVTKADNARKKKKSRKNKQRRRISKTGYIKEMQYSYTT